jgi:hypothetical protein
VQQNAGQESFVYRTPIAQAAFACLDSAGKKLILVLMARLAKMKGGLIAEEFAKQNAQKV